MSRRAVRYYQGECYALTNHFHCTNLGGPILDLGGLSCHERWMLCECSNAVCESSKEGLSESREREGESSVLFLDIPSHERGQSINRLDHADKTLGYRAPAVITYLICSWDHKKQRLFQ